MNALFNVLLSSRPKIRSNSALTCFRSPTKSRQLANEDTTDRWLIFFAKRATTKRSHFSRFTNACHAASVMNTPLFCSLRRKRPTTSSWCFCFSAAAASRRRVSWASMALCADACAIFINSPCPSARSSIPRNIRFKSSCILALSRMKNSQPWKTLTDVRFDRLKKKRFSVTRSHLSLAINVIHAASVTVTQRLSILRRSRWMHTSCRFMSCWACAISSSRSFAACTNSTQGMKALLSVLLSSRPKIRSNSALTYFRSLMKSRQLANDETSALAHLLREASQRYALPLLPGHEGLPARVAHEQAFVVHLCAEALDH